MANVYRALELQRHARQSQDWNASILASSIVSTFSATEKAYYEVGIFLGVLA